jgi:hypothetical protein
MRQVAEMEFLTESKTETKLEGPNLALSATASSPEGGSTGPHAAIDGNYATFWDKEDGKDLYRFRLDFKQPTEIAVISIEGHRHHRFAPKDFDILCDDRVVKNVREAVYDANKLIVSFPATTCESLELKITGYYGDSPAIRELKVHGATASE